MVNDVNRSSFRRRIVLKQVFDAGRAASPVTEVMGVFMIADHREAKVIPFLGALGERLQKQQLARGDYALVDVRPGEDGAQTPRVLAIVERKSLADYGASIRDGRMNNKYGLMEIGCQVYYLIEGHANPAPTTEYGGVPWRNIESSIFHLQTEWGVQVLRSSDPADSARVLILLLESMAARPPRVGRTLAAPVSGETRLIGESEPVAGSDQVGMLAMAASKTECERRAALWGSLSGIGPATAAKLAGEPVVVVLRGQVPAFLTTPQRARFEELGAPAWNATQRQFLGAIPGVGTKKISGLVAKAPCLRALWLARATLSAGDRGLLERAMSDRVITV